MSPCRHKDFCCSQGSGQVSSQQLKCNSSLTLKLKLHLFTASLSFYYWLFVLVSTIVCLSVCGFALPSPQCLSQTCLPVIVQCIPLLFLSEISSDASSHHYFLLCILSGMTTSISPPPPGLRQGYHVPMATAAGPHDSAQCEWESCQRLGIWVWCRHCG